MEIKKNEHCFWIGEDFAQQKASIRFVPQEEGVLLVTSTRVDTSLRSQGIAKILLDHLADYARKENLKLRAHCSYVVKKFQEDSSYDDVNIEKSP